jgi:NADH-quinone oxidoreductase subunit H
MPNFIQILASIIEPLPAPVKSIIKLTLTEPFIKAVVFPGALFGIILGLFAVWYERKILARIMLRVGPLHVGKVSGILQLVADALKILSKERIVPDVRNKYLFVLMPGVALVLSLLLFAFLPFGAGWIIYPSDIGLLLFFGVLAVSPIPIVLAGYAAGSKYPFIGMSRFALQLFGYEIPMFLSLTGIIMSARSFDLVKIVEAQSIMPFILPQFLGFIVFFITMIAESERIPFDIPTAESEIVSGWHTEYSGVYFLMIQFTSYEKTLALCVLASLIYLGGWHGPSIPFVRETISAPFWVILKALILFTILVIIRGAYPRLTLGRVLDIGWKYLIPLGFINLLLTSGLSALLVLG